MSNWPPAISDFKATFVREFNYGTGLDSVTDQDIQRGLNEMSPLFNIILFDQPTDQMSAYLYGAAHFMVSNIQNAGGLSAIPRGRGVRSSGSAPVTSKSVGSVSLSYQWPEIVTNSPVLNQFTKTEFGSRYLQMVAPLLVGNAAIVCGPGPYGPFINPLPWYPE